MGGSISVDSPADIVVEDRDHLEFNPGACHSLSGQGEEVISLRLTRFTSPVFIVDRRTVTEPARVTGSRKSFCTSGAV